MDDAEREEMHEPPMTGQASLGILARGAEKTFENAEQLFNEANILARSDAVARALCLHQISLEECSKINDLGAWAVSLILGLDVDQGKVLSAFRNHKHKNHSNAYMLEGSEAEKEAISRSDWSAALEAFKKNQDRFHEASNQAKNASLYVDWVDGEFVAPYERISGEMLSEIARRNANLLEYARNSLKMLKRIEHPPGRMRDILLVFIEQARKLQEGRSENLMSEMNTLLSTFFAEVTSELKD